MNRIGLIDNLACTKNFFESGFETASAEQILLAMGGNTGNIAFVYAIKKLIANQIKEIRWESDVIEVRRDCDLIVVCCANQLGSHVDLKGWSERIISFGLPVVLIGLGAQSDNVTDFPQIPVGTKNFLDTVQKFRISKNNSNISTRGNFSSEFLKQLGYDSVPTGCPSGLISHHIDLGKKILDFARISGLNKIAIAAGNPWHKRSAPLEKKLQDIVNNYAGEYIVQHPKIMVQLALNESKTVDFDQLQLLSKGYGFDLNSSALIDWFRKNATLFVDAPNWIRRLRKYDAVLGARFHGVALGIQAGIPGRVVAIDGRTAELAASNGVPQITLDDAMALSMEEIVASLKWEESDAKNLDNARIKSALAFVEFMSFNEIVPSSHLLLLTGN